MATKNSERAGKSRVFGFTDAISPACLSWSESIVSRRVCRFRSRAVVELENLALRHQLHVLRRQRPSVEREIRDLIRQMSSANPLWGAPRIHGELLKFGVEVSQATVAKYMVRRRGAPSSTWRSFLRNHAQGIAAIDMFVVASASFRLLYVMIILAHDRRNIVHTAVTEHPTAAWLSRQVTEAFPMGYRPAVSAARP